MEEITILDKKGLELYNLKMGLWLFSLSKNKGKR